MKTERIRRPSGTQYTFLLTLVRRGGAMGPVYLAKPQTIDACIRAGWVSAEGGVHITEAGRAAAAAFGGHEYSVAAAAAGLAWGADARGPVIDKGLPELVSATEIAELYGVSRAAVHKMIQSGRLPGRQAGATWVVRREVAEGITVDGAEIMTGQGRRKCPDCWGDFHASAPCDTPTGQ